MSKIKKCKNRLFIYIITTLFLFSIPVQSAPVKSDQNLEPGGGWEYDKGILLPDEECQFSIPFSDKKNNDSQDETLDAQGLSDIPASFDPRTSLTDIRDQGSYGLCWDYAANAVAEAAFIKLGFTDKSVDLSELHTAYFTHKNLLEKGEEGIPAGFEAFCNDGGHTTYVWDIWGKK